MKFEYNKAMKALKLYEQEKNVSEEVARSMITEAVIKAYRNESGIDDIRYEAVINDSKKCIDVFQIFEVVEEVEDSELQMDVEEARQYKKDAVIGDEVRVKVDDEEMHLSRVASSLGKNVFKQKAREEEKNAIYEEYKDKITDMVTGTIESVDNRLVIVNLGKTSAVMPRKETIPNEEYHVGESIHVVIKSVQKETKGSQVVVSRADENFVKRLFENEIPEIADGVVEIKAIAREAGERTKIAVKSHNPEIDPIGACIGQRGARVQSVIDEINSKRISRGGDRFNEEKIDVFLWSDDLTTLVKNSLAPAQIEEVLPDLDDDRLFVVVDQDKLSLAIGKKGQNAKLACKLTDHKIDIKTREGIIEMGKDYDALVRAAEKKKAELLAEKALRESKKQEKTEVKSAEDSVLAQRQAEAQAALKAAMEAEGSAVSNEMFDVVNEKVHADLDSSTIVDDTAAEEKPVEEVVSEEQVVEEIIEEDPIVEEEDSVEEELVIEEVKATKQKVNLEEVAAKNTYVSVFEKLADTSKPKQSTPAKKKYKKKDEDNFKTRNEDLLEQLRAQNLNKDIRPVYTEEELEEIERQQEEEENSQYDIDYDEYEEYYDDDNGN